MFHATGSNTHLARARRVECAVEKPFIAIYGIINGALRLYSVALPVLLHPSDSFVLVELSLEFILLQS